MLRYTENKTLQSFLMNEFSRVSVGVAKEICLKAELDSKTKPSKFVRWLFTKDYRAETFSNSDVEHFTNQYTAIIRNEIDLRVVKGEDIRKYYHIDSYDRNGPNGTLLGSCMGADGKQKFLDIYTKNDNVEVKARSTDDELRERVRELAAADNTWIDQIIAPDRLKTTANTKDTPYISNTVKQDKDSPDVE